MAVFRAFGFDVPGLRKEIFLEPGKIVRAGYPPLRVEVLNAISGVTFAECYEKRVDEMIEGVRVSFIDVQSLIRNKSATGRLKDQADVEALKKNKQAER